MDLDDPLVKRVESALKRVNAALGHVDLPERPDLTDVSRASRMMGALVQQLRAELGKPSGDLKRAALLERAELALDLQALRHDLETQRLGQSLHALEDVQNALSRLRGIDSPAQMMERGLEVLCEHCAFDRALLFRVEGSEIIVDSAYFSGDPEWAAEFVQYTRGIVAPLNAGYFPETDMFRRRNPVLIADPQNDPSTFKPIIEPIKTRSYVAAPIMPAGKVIGFLHADAYYAERNMTPLDRDTLWAFAEGFGYALQRTILIERLRSQRDQVRQMSIATEAVLNELTDAEIELMRADDQSAAITRTAAAVFVAPESRLEALLTRRELEVLELVADGETNGRIADRLVISEGTVKSHVKHILRKLRAANRAEAVSRYMKLRGQAAGRP